MNPKTNRPLFGSHSDTSAINIKNMVTELFGQMREPSPGTVSPKGSTGSLANGSVTKNISFQQQNNSEHLPWSSSAVPLSRNCNSNLTSEAQVSLVRTTSNASALTSLCADLSPSDSHFFEVLYIGKVRISSRKIPDSIIDDALTKFAQHDAEKARNHRRHSLLSSTGTSIDSTDSVENVNDEKKTEPTNEIITKKPYPISTSTTPLEPDKANSWKSVENVKTSDINNELDQEFDKFTKERVEKIKKPTPIPLEPSILVLNVSPKNNLGTVKEDEEKNDELHSVISDTASSITQFCQTNTFKETNKNGSNAIVIKDNNPFLNEIKAAEADKTKTDDVDPLMNIPIKKEIDIKKKTELKIVENVKAVVREDSPAPSLNFDEINRKPKTLVRSKTGLDSEHGKNATMPENKPFHRDRSASIGTLNLKTPISHLIGEQNRTMLFQVGRSELRLISPDRKQILLHRAFKDVASCISGIVNKNYFGFVCRETSEAYACYVFKCESDAVATEVVNAIRQAFVAYAELLKKSREKSPNMTCEHCPMLWYHRLCHDIEGMNEKKTHAFILRRMEQLPEDEQELIITKYQGGTNHMFEVSEHNAFLMMLLRAHCEAKQQRHIHDTAENRSEFLNQYLGSSTIFMKAKRSFASGFDHLLKRKASRDDVNAPTQQIKKEPSPLPSGPPLESSSEPALESAETSRSKSMSPAIQVNSEPVVSKTTNPIPPTQEERSEDIIKEGTPVNSPIMDIFMKVSDSRPAAAEAGSEPDFTWRQAIYEKVVQPTDADVEGESKKLLGLHSAPSGKRPKEQLRQLWKLAIDQTLLLVRMEKENAKLKESAESSAVRRIKLEYTELGVCDTGVILMWDSLLSRDASQPMAKVDRHMLTQAVIQGVPRMTRGGVWYFLAEQACLFSPPPDVKRFPHYHTPYHTLLSGLTKHQHAILIDLGRTFPQHSYFASALGPGQLALYNILKAYSLLDPDVGYCQGLSFVAGVLLLHMEEAEAFILLRHLMFRRGLRKQYLPDMSALQVQLYQLSRLLRDHEPELHAKLEALDISPALYAAPWMLTLFTSQFPLGFVVRVFDLIFLESPDVIFSVSLALLSVHRDGLMLCESCEEAAEYLKHKLPDVDRGVYEKVMKKVHNLDISRQLAEYAVEYAVLREEMPRLAALTEENKRLVADNRKMCDELDSAMDALNSYQSTKSRVESQNKLMEQHLTLLSRYISAHHKQDMPIEIKKIIHNYSKKLSFSSKITSFSSKFTSNENDEDPKKNFKTGMSTPNLFSKISKEDVMNAVNKDKNKSSPETDRRHFIMKKSQSVHSGLIANNLKNYQLKVLDEKSEKENKKDNIKIDNTNIINENLKDLKKKNIGFFANTHEQIRQERLFEQQLKHDFDENLKRLDEKTAPKSYIDDLNIFQSTKSMSLNLKSDKNDMKLTDSGFVTPLSPFYNDKDCRDDALSIISHPLSDCDVDIKFDGQSTKLKQIRPLKCNGNSNVQSKQS